jgi:hypothetical protein
MQSLERKILAELKEVSGNKKLRLKDIMEWSTGKVKTLEDETPYFLPKLQIHCAVKVVK